MTPAMNAAWQALARAAEAGRATPLRDMFAADPGRFARLSIAWNDWLLDVSKQRVDANSMGLLHALASQ